VSLRWDELFVNRVDDVPLLFATFEKLALQWNKAYTPLDWDINYVLSVYFFAWLLANL
jgi:hypothetical protein